MSIQGNNLLLLQHYGREPMELIETNAFILNLMPSNPSR
jgi:hypothetical protein